MVLILNDVAFANTFTNPIAFHTETQHITSKTNINTNDANTKKRDKNKVLVAVVLNTEALQTASEMTLEG